MCLDSLKALYVVLIFRAQHSLTFFISARVQVTTIHPNLKKLEAGLHLDIKNCQSAHSAIKYSRYFLFFNPSNVPIHWSFIHIKVDLSNARTSRTSIWVTLPSSIPGIDSFMVYTVLFQDIEFYYVFSRNILKQIRWNVSRALTAILPLCHQLFQVF